MNQYEAMFLFDPTFGSSFESCEAEIRRILVDRAEAEILFCRKWDERRLAYKINGRKRGVYVLVYFKAPPEKIAPLERDAKLSENILRVLVLRADNITHEMMEQAVASATTSTEKDEAVDQPGAPSAKTPADVVVTASEEKISSAVQAESGENHPARDSETEKESAAHE